MAENTITSYTANGAIAADSGCAQLEKSSEGAYTLAAPAADAGTRLKLEILANAADVQVVTGVFKNGPGSYTTLTFANNGAVTLISGNGVWVILGYNRGVTIS
jgi:hypothetical protein